MNGSGLLLTIIRGFHDIIRSCQHAGKQVFSSQMFLTPCANASKHHSLLSVYGLGSVSMACPRLL